MRSILHLSTPIKVLINSLKTPLLLVFFLITTFQISNAQTTLAAQDFESSGSDTWSPTINPDTYEVGGDKWAIVSSLSSITPQSGSNFWGMQDLNNSNGGGNFDHTLTFENFDVSGVTDVQISFYYYTIGFESADYLKYEVFEDDNSTGEVVLDDDTGGAWKEVTISITAGISNVKLVLIGNQNGGSDYGAFDNILLTGISTAPTITTSVSSLDDFGTISNGSSSASASYTVSGSDLTADVTITAPSNFEVSTDDANFSSSVTLAFADVNGGPQTVYARFSPTSGTNQTITGNITHTSTGATDVNMAVSGTETGNDGNNPPTDISLSSSDIDENLVSGTTVGTISTTDADESDTYTYTLVSGDGDDDNGSFAIDGSNLNSGELFDFETKSSYSIRIQTEDGGGETLEESFTISINDINDAPTAVELSNTYIDDGTSNGTTIGTLSSTDQESGDTHTYSLVSGDGDTDNSSFTIDESNLNIAENADYNTKSSYSIRIQTDDGNGGTYAQSFTLNVQDLTALLIDENFDYGETADDLTTVSGGNWNNHSGSGAVGYITTSLSLTDYGSSGVGGSATVDPSNGEDVNRLFTTQSMNSVYASALINLSAAETSENYFYHFRNESGSFYGRVYAKDDGSGNLNIGIRNAGDGSTSYSSTNYTYNTDYILVLKYDLSSGTASIFVLSAVAYSEPTADAEQSDGSGASNLAAIAFRQSSNIPTGTIDGIRIGKSWGALFPATLGTSVSSLTDFGSVDNGSSSTSQSYTVSGSNLTEDVIVTAPDNFEVSSNDTDFSSSITLTAADINGGDQTVYARFSPSSGTNQALSGDILHTNASSSTLRVSVTGTETGNNEAPTDIAITSTVVDENQDVGTTVGTLSTTDPNESDTHTYTLVDEVNRSVDNGSFTIDGAELKTAESFNQEVKDSYSIRIQTSDGNGGIYQEDFTITVNDINDAPIVANIIDDQNVNEDEALSFQFAENTFSDEDEDGLTYTATLENDDALPSWLTFTAGTRTFSGTPDNDQVGTLNIKVTADDSNGGTANDVFQLEIINTNDAPSFTSDAVTSADEDAIYTYNITANDVDAGASLIFDAPTLPEWLILTDNENGTATLTGTPLNNHVGDNSVVINVTDGIIASPIEQSFTIAVANTNDAPEFTSTPLTGAVQDIVYTYNITVTDVDAASSLTISAPTKPDWLTFTDNANGTATLTGTPNNTHVGDHNVVLNVTDGIVTNPVEQSFTIGVVNTNDAPEFTSTPVTAVNEDAVYTYNITATDNDAGAVLTFDSSTLPGWLILTDHDNGTATLTGTPTNDNIGDNQVVITVSDGIIPTPIEQSFTIAVANVNDVPSFTIGIDQTLDEDAGAQTVAGWATSISDGDDGTQTLSFNVSNDNNGLFSVQPSIDATSGDLTFTPADNANGSATVVVSLSDDGGTENGGVDTSADQSFVITVNSVNDAPEFTSTEVTSVDEDAVYTYNITATDADADATLTINGTTVPSWLSFTDNGNGSATLTGTPTNDNVGNHNVVIELSDGIANTLEQNFTIAVANTNDAPTFTSSEVTSVDEDAIYTYNITASDDDTDATLTISGVVVPSWLSFTDNGNGVATLTGTPTNDNVGDNAVIIEVSDGIAEAVRQSFSVTVNNVNDAPSFTSTPVTSVDEDAAYTYNITASDVDAGDVIAISGATVPTWMTLTDNGDGTATLTGVPKNNEVGDHDVVLEVSDDIASIVTQSFTVTVVNTNDAPTLGSIDDFELCPGDSNTPIELSSLVTDIDAGDSFTFEQSSTPISGVSVDLTGSQLTVTHNATSDGTFDITVTVSDSEGATATSTFTVTINYLDLTISQNENVLTAPTADSYQWLLNGNAISGETNQTFTAHEVGDFSVQVTYGNCSGTSAAVTIDAATGINFEDLSENISVYPIPSDNFITLESNVQLKGNVMIQLMDLNGRTVFIKNQFVDKIDISSIPNGIYILQLINDNKRAVKRVVKN